MNGDDRAGARGDRRRDRLRIDEIIFQATIDQHRFGPGIGDGFGGGDKGVGNGDDFVTRADSESPQDQVERIRAGTQSDALGGAAKIGPSLFKFRHLGAEDELPMVEDLGESRVQLGAQVGYLQRQILKGDAKRCGWGHGSRRVRAVETGVFCAKCTKKPRALAAFVSSRAGSRPRARRRCGGASEPRLRQT